jgi:hypothetical protein
MTQPIMMKSITEEELEAEEAAERAEAEAFTFKESVEKLAELVRMDCGASDAAKSVLLFMWNSKFPIIELNLLDPYNHIAAIKVLSQRWMNDRTLISWVPEIQDWARESENN